MRNREHTAARVIVVSPTGLAQFVPADYRTLALDDACAAQDLAEHLERAVAEATEVDATLREAALVDAALERQAAAELRAVWANAPQGLL